MKRGYRLKYAQITPCFQAINFVPKAHVIGLQQTK